MIAVCAVILAIYIVKAILIIAVLLAFLAGLGSC